MATGSNNIQLITLEEDDISGAKFVYSDIGKHNVEQLKRWLYCRGLPRGGNKTDLIKRCEEAVKQKIPLDPSVDGGTWYEIKAAKLRGPTKCSSDGVLDWKEFPMSGIPKLFNQGHIYHHLIESVGALCNLGGNDSDEENDDQNSQDCQTAKPLRRGQQYFDSGNVTRMEDALKGATYHVKSQVLASMRKQSYKVYVAISINSGFVQEATCECKSSALGRCGHIAAVLYAIDHCKQCSANEDSGDLPCTSKPMTWNVGRKSGKNPQKITDTVYASRKRSSTSSLINFDPRPRSLQKTEITPSEINTFISSLQASCKPADNEVRTSMWETLLRMHYEDYTLTDSQVQNRKELVDILLFNLTPGISGPQQITESQGDEQWHLERLLRVTASNAKAICTATSDVTRERLVKSQLYGKSIKTASLTYGQKNEDRARKEFATKCTMFEVKETGFWVNKQFPGLGASPDGIITDIERGTSGLLEIKCPAVLKTTPPHEPEQVMNKKQLQTYCLEKKNGKWSLREKHSYFYQVQMQMGILEKEYTYFVVWSPEGMHFEKINFRPEFFNDMLTKLTIYHRNYLCPEYFEMRLPRRLSLFKLTCV